MSYHFTWAHPAKEVFVTGSFDNWSKSEELVKNGDIFSKTVQLPVSTDKIVYKFVVDGSWTYDHTAKTEQDHEGNTNNVLYPTDLIASTASAAISSVAPTSSTNKMAGEQPLETPSAPGAFPTTPQNEMTKELSVDPIAASSGPGNPIKLAPGEPVPHSSNFTDNTVTSQVHDDPELVAADSAFSVAPIAGTGGASNPVNLAAGQSVPHSSTLTGHTVESNVKLDKASYEKADALPPVLAPVLSPTSEKEAAGVPVFTGTEAGKAIIPESGLPMGMAPASETDHVGPHINSVAPTSTTAALAGAVPLEPRGVPEIVGESQEAAHVSPEASANPDAVVEKSAVEQELKSKVAEEPATSESGAFGKSEAGIVGGAVAGLAATGALVGAAISSVTGNTTTNNLAGQVPVEERGVPEVVQESQQEAHASPEAAANPEAVEEKSAMEKELQAAVPKAPATSESGLLGKSEGGITGAIAGGVAAAGAAAAGGAYALRKKTKETTGTDPVSVLPTSLQQKIDGDKPMTSATITDVAQETAVPRQFALGEPVRDPATDNAARQTTSTVPAEVTASQQKAHVGAEASSNTEAVQEKQAMEQELLSKVKSDDAQGEPAPSNSAALSETAPAATTAGAPQLGPIAAAAPIDLDNSPAPPVPAKENKPLASGDVSPMTGGGGAVAASRAPNRATPEKRNSFMDKLKGTSTPESSGDASDGKAKRRSFFGKLKAKLSKS